MKPLTVSLFLIVAVFPASAQTMKCTITGRVEDAAGRPVPGATVVILQAESDRALANNLPALVLDGGSVPRLVGHSPDTVELPRIETGADGRFQFEAEIPADDRRVEWFTDRKGRTCRIPPLILMAFTPELSTSAWFQPGRLPEGATRTDPVTLVLHPRARLEVRLVDAAGKPVAGDEVRLGERLDRLLVRSNLGSRRFGWPAWPLAYRGTSDEAGRVSFSVVAGVDLALNIPSRALVTIGDRVVVGDPDFGWSPPEGFVSPLRLAAGEDRPLVVKPPPPVRVSGVVRDWSGNPVSKLQLVYGTGPRRGWFDVSDEQGRFAFPEPVPAGGLVVTLPGARGDVRCPAPKPKQGDAVHVNARFRRGPVVVRPGRRVGAVMLATPGELAFPNVIGTEDFEFDWRGGERAHVIVSEGPESGPDAAPRVGFFVQKDVRVAGDRVDVKVPEIEHDATLDVSFPSADGEPPGGSVCLVCVSVDRYPTVPVFAQIAVPARSRVRFPALQAGWYVLGYIPDRKPGERDEAPGAPRSRNDNKERGFWRGPLGRLTRDGSSGRWRPIRIVRGANEVLLDTATARERGALVIRPTGRNGKLLPEFSATLATREDSSAWAWRTNRSHFVAGDDGVIRIHGVPPGVYQMRLSPPWPDQTIRRVQLVAVPRHGTATIDVRFDLDPPEASWPPRLVDRAFSKPGVR